VVLRDLTGAAWQIVQELGEIPAVDTLVEIHAKEDQQRKVAASGDPLVAEVLGMFPGAEVESVQPVIN
jgi:hypothetical protein